MEKMASPKIPIPTFNSNSNNVGVKKAMAQLRDYTKHPVDGTKIFVIENDIRTFHVNTRIEHGIYEGLVVHWELQIPEKYPFVPARGKIADGFHFTREHHEHVFERDGLCTDYLSNFEYMHKNASAYGGWTPSGTLVQLMIAMKEFFAEPDMKISDSVVQEAFQRNANFRCQKCSGSINDIYLNSEQDGSEKSDNGPEKSESSRVDNDDVQRRTRARQELICPVIMRSPLDDSNVLIGLPVALKRVQRKPEIANTSDRIRQLRFIEMQLFPEFLSFEAYMQSLAIEGANYDNLDLARLRSPMGNWYTHLILIYLNRQHYDRAEVYLKTLLTVFSCGSDGTQLADYHPSMFVKVYPALMNKIIVSLLRCDAHESDMLLTAFANLLRTYRHACARYPEVRRINDLHVMEFCYSLERQHKTWTNDLGELLFKMAALNPNAYPKCTMNNPPVKMAFMKEFFARQVHWVHKYWSSPERGMACTDNFFAFFHKPSITIDECSEFLRQFSEGCQVSLKVMLFNLECLSVLMTPDFEERLDRNYGLLEVDQLQQFREAVIAIKNLNKLSVFFQRANYPIQNFSQAFKLVKTAYEDAKNSGYWYENNRVVTGSGYNPSRQ
uniref:UBC core domain-containing protein n=1 Tax=Acrobeloides nanus TaxID=290746 RepID=A0A914EIJ9_9BILA